VWNVAVEGRENAVAATLDDIERRALAEDRLRALTAIGRAVTRGDSQDALQRIVAAAMHALGAASSSLGVWDETAQVLRTRLNLGELADWEEPFPSDEWYVADQSTWLAGMDSGHLGMIVSLDDPAIAADDRYYLERLGKTCSMSVPILRDGEWWGELFVARRADQPPFTDRDLEWGTAVAAQVGAAVEALDHLDRVARLAHTDVLTGLANRLTMEEWMRTAIERHKLDGDDVAFVVCDLNGLHEINSDQGHDAGDRALKQFARVLRQATASLPDVLAARFGGDEFCLAVVGEGAGRLVEIAGDVTRRGWDMLPFGVACGVASTRDPIGPVESAGRLFRLADAAQFRAKRTQSRVPVVAGRALPAEAAVPLNDLLVAPVADRRLLRGRDQANPAHLLEAGLRALDQVSDDAVRARLALVADIVSNHVDGLGWWLSWSAAGSEALTTVEFSAYREIPKVSPGEFDVTIGEQFLLADFPDTDAALSGGAFFVETGDPAANPAEVAVLDGLAAIAAVAAGGVAADGDRWLVEVYADALSGTLREVLPVLRVLVLAALHPNGR
jgi:diguanylate cyclase (GGDEF)-like protein